MFLKFLLILESFRFGLILGARSFEEVAKILVKEKWRAARIIYMRETDAETMEWKEAKSGARSRSIIRALSTHTHTHTLLYNIDISIRAWCVIYTCGRGERVAVERVATGGNRHHRSGSGID